MIPELNIDPYTLLGWAVLIGVMWNRLSSVKESVDENNRLIREQNGRISTLEQAEARRSGHEEGYRDAKQKYQDGTG